MLKKLLSKKQKGFTIVELVIVIAVIAVLAAILIPTFINLTAKANKAADESLVKNLNTALATQEQIDPDGKNKTMYDAVEDLKEYGYLLTNLVTKSNEKLLWEKESNRFLLEKDADQEKPLKYWRIQDNLSEQKYNVFAGSKFSSSDDNLDNVTVGFDCGYHTDINEIIYVNSGTSKEVDFRTSGKLTNLYVNGKDGDDGDTVNHYGFANVVYVNSVGNLECYHELGTTSTLEAKAGKVIVESDGSVFELKKSAEAVSGGNAPSFENKGGNILVAEAGTIAEEEISSDVFNINSLDQLCSFRDATNSGRTFEGITVNLNCDIKLTNSWTPISNYYRKTNAAGGIDDAFAGTFDGKGHTITGLTNEGLRAEDINTGYNNTTPAGGTEYVYGFFASVNNAVIKNITFKDVKIINIDGLLGDCNAACVGFINATNTAENLVQLDNIKVYGEVKGYDNVGGIVGMARNVTDKSNPANHYLTLKNCYFEGNLSATRRSAGIIAQLSSDIYLATLNNCKAKGTASSHYSQDTEKSTDLPYYLCGGLATWGQTKRINTISCTSEMTATAESVSNTVTGSLANNFIIVEKTSSKTTQTLDYSPYKVESNGLYEKNASYVPTVVNS